MVVFINDLLSDTQIRKTKPILNQPKRYVILLNKKSASAAADFFVEEDEFS